MNIAKRAWVSVMRRKANSMILLLIVFILANVLLVTLSVTTSLKATKDSVLSKLNPIVTTEMDFEKAADLPESKFKLMSSDMANEVYEKTKSLVKSYDYSMSTHAQAKNDFKSSDIPKPDDIDMGMPYFKMSGTQVGKSSDVENGDAKLIKGGGLTKSDIKEGKRKVLISKQLAETNNLDVGSTFLMDIPVENFKETSDDGEPKKVGNIEEEFEVAGILEYKDIEKFIATSGSKKSEDINEYFSIIEKADNIIMPNEVVKSIYDKQLEIFEQNDLDGKELLGDADVVTPTYLLKDYKDVEKFKEIAKKTISSETIKVVSTSDSYKETAKPLESMESLLDMIFVITIISSVVILSLVLSIFMYLRQKELGIFLALGERKGKIIGQLLFETIIVCIVGASLALISASFISSMIADSAMQSMLAPPDMEANGGMMSFGSSNVSNIDAEFISEQYEGSFSIMTIITFYGVMIVTIATAQLLTTIYLLRMNPKKILM